MTAFAATTTVLEAARAASAYTAVTAEVGTTSGAVWRYAAGVLSGGSDERVTDDTVFDLASLTKVLATTTLALRAVERGSLSLGARIADLIPAWTGTERAAVTIRDLLEHASGLPAYRPYYRAMAGRGPYEAAIAAEPLEYEPRTRSIYSDLGFMLLGFVLEDAAGDSLERQFAGWRDAAGIDAVLSFRPAETLRARIAATEDDPWRGRVLRGEVHDENAAALGGVAGHAGLFGTAAAVGEAARWWLRLLRGSDDPAAGVSASTAAQAAVRSTVPGSSRGLGWDTMLPTSSCGSRWSARAIGHTGFTGTSLWLDPSADRYAVLLTNRVHPTRTNDAIQGVRRAFHDAVAADLG